MTTQLLTHSRMDVFKICRRKHWFAYEEAIRPTEDAKALRMGSAYHDALECLANGGSFEQATEVVYLYYDARPNEYDQYEWEIERETVLRLVCGYVWRWQGQEPEHLAAEQTFELSLKNPDTGASTPNWVLAGKIDGIVRLEDGRHAVMEHKLLSEELESDSPLWRRLRIDHQISLYVLAGRRLDFPVDCVLYNVTRKPTIKPTAVPLLDGDGLKIVLDTNGDRVRTKKGDWRQTGSTEDGFVLQTRPMTAEEWGEKLAADISERPQFYYARVEVPRLDQDLAQYEAELWEIQRTIRDAQLKGRHYRTCNKNTCGLCPYFDLCSTGWQTSDALPDGFARVEDLHPELLRINRGESNVTTSASVAS